MSATGTPLKALPYAPGMYRGADGHLYTSGFVPHVTAYHDPINAECKGPDQALERQARLHYVFTAMSTLKTTWQNPSSSATNEPVVLLEVSSNGKLAATRVLHSSGNAATDAAFTNSFGKLFPLLAFDPRMSEETVKLVVSPDMLATPSQLDDVSGDRARQNTELQQWRVQVSQLFNTHWRSTRYHGGASKFGMYQVYLEFYVSGADHRVIYSDFITKTCDWMMDQGLQEAIDSLNGKLPPLPRDVHPGFVQVGINFSSKATNY